jgi:predicted TIM-barrel fold metal-dependent hydrolase
MTMTASATRGCASSDASPGLPTEFADAHHHFLDTKNNEFSKVFLGSLLQNFAYLPDDYHHHVVEPLQNSGVKLVGSVHVEGMPDDGVKEAEWISSFQEDESTTVAAIIASCDLTDTDVDAKLQQLKQEYPKVKGVRWILDCVGPFDPSSNPATHVGTLRHDGIDYLRGSSGGYDGQTVPEFERGFAVLSKYGFSFDLQCAPAQLEAAAALFARHPNIPACIDHLGKPRALAPRGKEEGGAPGKAEFDEKEIAQWRNGMKAMAQLPHVCVKISMLGYAVPGWTTSPERTALVKQLVHETVRLFGANRCMVALNWWKDAATSDADGRSDVGPDPVQFLEYMSSFFADLSEQERQMLFVGAARAHYRF